MRIDDITTLPADIQFSIARPSGRGKRFRFRSRRGSAGPWITFHLDEVQQANARFLEGVADERVTYQKLVGIREYLYTKREVKPEYEYTDHNRCIFERFWAAKYPLRRLARMKAPDASRRDYELSLGAIDPLPVDTAPIEQLADAIYTKHTDRPQIVLRRAIWLNSILKWLGRAVIEDLGERGRPVVTYLNEAEFTELLTLVTDGFDRMLMRVAFYTGMRIGEIFGLSSRDLRGDYIRVVNQMYRCYRGHKLESTKTNSERNVVLVPAVAEDVVRFTRLPATTKKAKRDVKWADVIGDLCEKLWPGDAEKHITFHGLRHSNAIWLLSKGATLQEVAQHLGNRAEVTERYYSGFELKKESIERLRRLVS
jgi:integrase